MSYGIQELVKKIIATVLKDADAKRNLTQYLNTKVRPVFLEKVNIDSILKPLVNQAEGKLGHGVDGELFKEDLVDMFIDEDGGDELLGALLSNAREKGLEEKEDRAVVVHGGELSKELAEKVKSLKDEFGKETYKYLEKFFHNRMLKWVGTHQKEAPSEEGEGREEAVLDEKELEREIKQEYKWEEGLIDKVLALIDRKVEEKHRALYKALLKGRFLSKEKRSLKDIGEEVKLDESNVMRHEQRLAEMLKNFLKGEGLGPKFDLSKKEVEVPPMEEILKNEENRKDLKDYLKGRGGKGRAMSDFTMEVLDLLSDGKSITEIVDLLKSPRVSIQSIKNRHFDPVFKEWYKDMVEDIRQVCARVIAKTVRVKKELTPEEMGKGDIQKKLEKEVSKIHETLVNNAIEHSRIRVLVNFRSNYDNMAPASEKSGDADFKWLRYDARIEESRRGVEKEDGTRSEWSIQYEYTHTLNEDGTIAEKGESSLKVDGKEVSGSHPLVRYIDEHLEKEILKEGAIPHGKFPVEYVNTKTGKHYNGTNDFLKHYEGILVPDPVHEGRMLEKSRWEEKKRLGPSLAVGEKAEIKELKNTLKKNLKTETDEGNKKKIRDHLKQLDDLLDMRGKMDLEEIEDIINEEMLIRKPEEVQGAEEVDYDSLIEGAEEVIDYDNMPRYGAMFPEPQTDASKKMVELFKDYQLTSKPNPRQWLLPGDLIVLAKTIRIMIENKLEKEMKAKKPKGVKREEWEEDLKRIEGVYKTQIADAKKNFPAFIEELRIRKDKFEKSDPRGFAEWSRNTHNTGWVNNEEEVNKVISRVRQELEKEPQFEKEKRAPGLKMLEKTKWGALEGFLHASQKGFIAFGERLKEASLKPIAGEGNYNKLRSDYVRIKDEYNSLSDKVLEMSKSEDAEGKKDLDKFLMDLRGLEGELKKIDEVAKAEEVIPAISSAEVLKEFSSYFSKLYSIYSGILWFREKYALVISEEVPVKEKKKTIDGIEIEMSRLRNQVVQQAKDVGETSLRARDEIRSNIVKMRSGLNKFIEGMGELKSMYKEEHKIHTAEKGETYEERLKKYIFPEHLIQEANGVVERLRKERKDVADVADKEFKEVVDNIMKAFRDREGFEERIDAVAKKKGISKDKAAIQLKRHEEALSKAAIDTFVTSWTDILHGGIRKEKSPLGNKHHTEYDRVGQFVEDHLPDLFKLAPPEEEPKEPSAGIATPKRIRETIEREWSKDKEPTPEELTKIYRFEAEEMGFGGGKGGKSKHRAKPAKVPVPLGTYEQIKDDLGKLITHKAPQQVVLTIMAMYVKRVRDAIKGLKEGEYLDIGDVIDGIVYLLKHTQNMIVNLNTHPSTRTLESPSHALGAPQMTGTPDIPIDDYKEAVGLFNKIKGIYDEINYYIKPDTVGVPPESLKDVRKPESRRYLPRGLSEWIQWFSEREGKLPVRHSEEKVSSVVDRPCQLSFNVARKFAGVEISEDDFEAILS